MTKLARSERRSFKEYMVKSFNSAKRGLEKSRSPKSGLEEPSPTESGFEAADSAESGLQSGSAQSGVKWYREDQALGNKIGDIDVQCTYEPKKARWVLEQETKPSRIPEEGTNPSGNFEEKKDLSGMLLFEIRFKDLGNHLQWATVTIDVGTPHNIDTLPIIEKAAPKDVITGNATDQHVHKATHINPKLGIEAVGIGANAEVGQRGNEIEMTISNRWFFNAGTPSQGQPGIYQTEFNWSRTSHEDQMASKRRYIEVDEVKPASSHLTLSARPKEPQQIESPSQRSSKATDAATEGLSENELRSS
ncbi:hypothetical protein KCU73_g6788, partial [Aureobasidium melanogenum]